MVHVKNCPLSKRLGRGKPVFEFWKNGKPQMYCYGYTNPYWDDEPLDECKNCLDWYLGEQMEKDFEETKEKGEIR